MHSFIVQKQGKGRAPGGRKGEGGGGLLGRAAGGRGELDGGCVVGVCVGLGVLVEGNRSIKAKKLYKTGRTRCGKET